MMGHRPAGLGTGAAGNPVTMSDNETYGDDDPGLSSTIPAGTDVDQLRDGGPTSTPGVATTTGGTAGPNSFRTPPRSGPGVANTTTGDATTGAMDTRTDGSTSDATTGPVE